MPGIVGVVTTRPRPWAEQRLMDMVAAMRHEPFYTTGTFVDETAGVYVGWVARDARTRLSSAFCEQCDDATVIFSGEEFSVNTSKNQDHSDSANAQWRSSLTQLYRSNLSFPAQLNGRFHGIVCDHRTGAVTLFNDRYGMHRLYFHQAKDAFYFAAEAKAILAVLPQLKSLDLRSLGELVSCGCVLENRTLFTGIEILPGGARWQIRAGAVEDKGSYFQPREWEEQSSLDSESYYRRLREVFAASLSQYFSAPCAVGMSLTGGLDTRMIMAWQRLSPGALPCYSFGGMFRDCQDVILARKIAQQSGQPHQVIRVGDDFLKRFPEYAERTIFLSDGCTEVSRSADLYVNQQAREIAPVRMTGNYGSEILRAVRAFKPVEPAPGLFRPEFSPYLQAARETYRELTQTHPLSFAAFRQAPWHHYGLLTLEQTQLAIRSPFLDNELVQTVYRAPKAAAGQDFCLRLIADGNKTLSRIRTDRGLNGTSMPLLGVARRGLLEFTFKAEYACDYGMPQWAARIDRVIPVRPERLFLGRHKFCHFRVWYRDALSSYIRDILLDRRTRSRPYLNPRMVDDIVNGHVTGHRNYTVEIHKLLTLELIHRHFIDNVAI